MPKQQYNTPFRGFLPPHSVDELAALHTNLTINGQIGVVEIDTDLNILDGHVVYDWLIEHDRPIKTKMVGALTTIEQRKAYIINRHAGRRSIAAATQKQKHEYIDVLVLANPGLSDERIARLIGGISASAVLRRRHRLLQSQRLIRPEKVLGADGKARRLPRPASELPTVSVGRLNDAEYVGGIVEAAVEFGVTCGGPEKFAKLKTKALRAQRRAKIIAGPDAALPPDYRVECTDFRKLDVKPGTVDLICTDIVWSNDHKPEWIDLAEWAAIALKPTGCFCTLTGVTWSPDVADAFRTSLNYQWTIAVIYQIAIPIDFKAIYSKWRPAWIFSRPGGAKHKTFGNISDVITVDDKGPEKGWHEWQQSIFVFSELVKRLSRPGTLVVDPQCGTGTTGIACRQLGRRFIGGDIDPEQVKIARHRIAMEGMPGRREIPANDRPAAGITTSVGDGIPGVGG